ncbi:LysM peptidoglycan-binding domain-containing protein [Mycobacteroides abscessus]|uniref:LysM peptidoglycan-binding domain-containing protein n=1 Tax=Mycobacteroides abscessus TaxID=36809 RepID=UPI000C25CDD0|nr:LysM peptidoglycan-binding domain-containing protein [Mycobacteroides abscessus]
MADTLTQGQKLDSGQSLTSNNGAYTLTLQDDGNLVLTEGGSPVWASDTSGHSAGRAEVQSDGNFVVYDNGGGALWSSNTEGRTDVKLVLQDDRNLVLYSGADSVWSSGTQTDTPVAPAAESVEVAPAAVEEPAPAPEPRTYTVESGDTLWAIAERFYSDGNQYQKIADASGIANPDLIQPGQVLTIPE